MKVLRTPDDRFSPLAGFRAIAPDLAGFGKSDKPAERSDYTYKAGARVFPSLVPVAPDDPSSKANRKAWEILSTFNKPFLTAFSDGDPITAGGERIFQKRVPGAKGQSHQTIRGGGHFLQEDCGEAFAESIVKFIRQKR